MGRDCSPCGYYCVPPVYCWHPQADIRTNGGQRKKAAEGDDPETVNCKGCGWWLTLVDLLCAEYGWPLDAVLDLSVARALCLRAAIAERNGAESGTLSFLEKQLLKNLNG